MPSDERVIFQGLKLPNVSPRVREVLNQVQKININDMPQVAGIMIRIVVELVLTDAILRGTVIGKEGDTLKWKMKNGLEALDPDCSVPKKRRKELELAWIRTQDKDGFAVQTLNSFVHNVYGKAAPSEVRALSLSFRPLIDGLDNLIGKSK